MWGRRVAAALGVALVVATATRQGHAQPSRTTGLTAAPQVARIYDAIFDARARDVAEALGEACAATALAGRPAQMPPEACRVLEALDVWWLIQQDVHDTTHDPSFTTRIEAAIAATEAWVTREPERAEAWFYLGASYAARAQWRSLRAQSLAAARDGKRIKQSLERATTIDPGLGDARFGIGLYQYYADVAPAALKLLRWMLLLPGGDRAAGLRAMEQARTRAQVMRSEAEYQLYLVYLWYEHRPEDALRLIRGLVARHPRNPLFLELEADLHDVHRSDPGAALRTWRALRSAAERGSVEHAALALPKARLGVAIQLDRLGDTDLAIDELRALVAAAPRAPTGLVARARLALGLTLDRMGARAEAVAQYQAALAAAAAGDPLRIGPMARRALREQPEPNQARAYRMSLEGWRAFERGALADAARLLDQARATTPLDPATRYRLGRLRVAQARTREGIEILEAVISDARTPPYVYADACFAAAEALDRQGEKVRASELYRQVLDAFGVDPSLRAAAQRALGPPAK